MHRLEYHKWAALGRFCSQPLQMTYHWSWAGPMYDDDVTLYMSATTVDDLSTTLNKELQLVSDRVKNNRMVLNISKTKCIVLGSQYYN